MKDSYLYVFTVWLTPDIPKYVYVWTISPEIREWCLKWFHSVITPRRSCNVTPHVQCYVKYSVNKEYIPMVKNHIQCCVFDTDKLAAAFLWNGILKEEVHRSHFMGILQDRDL